MSWVARLWRPDMSRKVWLAVLVLWVIVAPAVMIYQNVEIQNAQTDTHALQATIDRGLHNVVPMLTQGQLVLIEQLAWIECAETSILTGLAHCGPPPAIPNLHPKARSRS